MGYVCSPNRRDVRGSRCSADFPPGSGLLWPLSPGLFAGGGTSPDQYRSGKSAAEIYASDCATCHKTPRGLADGKNSLTLAEFPGEHYTASGNQASALAAYVLAAGGAEPAPKQSRTPSTPGRKSPGRTDARSTDAKSTDAKSPTPDLRTPGQRIPSLARLRPPRQSPDSPKLRFMRSARRTNPKRRGPKRSEPKKSGARTKRQGRSSIPCRQPGKITLRKRRSGRLVAHQKRPLPSPASLRRHPRCRFPRQSPVRHPPLRRWPSAPSAPSTATASAAKVTRSGLPSLELGSSLEAKPPAEDQPRADVTVPRDNIPD